MSSRSKFLSDDWMYERAFLDVNDEPHSEWWHTKPVSTLKIREPVTVSTSTSIQAVLDIMHARGFDQVPVISDDGYVWSRCFLLIDFTRLFL